jgi:hypothetical protein
VRQLRIGRDDRAGAARDSDQQHERKGNASRLESQDVVEFD